MRLRTAVTAAALTLIASPRADCHAQSASWTPRFWVSTTALLIDYPEFWIRKASPCFGTIDSACVLRLRATPWQGYPDQFGAKGASVDINVPLRAGERPTAKRFIEASRGVQTAVQWWAGEPPMSMSADKADSVRLTYASRDSADGQLVRVRAEVFGRALLDGFTRLDVDAGTVSARFGEREVSRTVPVRYGSLASPPPVDTGSVFARELLRERGLQRVADALIKDGVPEIGLSRVALFDSLTAFIASHRLLDSASTVLRDQAASAIFRAKLWASISPTPAALDEWETQLPTLLRLIAAARQAGVYMNLESAVRRFPYAARLSDQLARVAATDGPEAALAVRFLLINGPEGEARARRLYQGGTLPNSAAQQRLESAARERQWVREPTTQFPNPNPRN